MYDVFAWIRIFNYSEGQGCLIFGLAKNQLLAVMEALL